MKYRSLWIFAAVIPLILSNCTYHDLDSGEKVPASSMDYLMFGHTESFCLSCDAVYKIVNGKLFGANHQVIGDPDEVQLVQLPNSSYNLVSSLTTQIPGRIMTGSTGSINHIGTYFPDAGHTYIEVSQNKKAYRWYIEPGNLPGDLQDFVTAVNEAMSKLN
jgi:hypothetical protein